MLSFTTLSIPFFGAAAFIAGLALFLLVVGGDVPVRMAGAVAVAGAMPWALANGLILCSRDPDLARRLCKFYVGTIPLWGAAVMLAALVVSGLLQRHLRLLALVTLVAVGSCALTWSTDLVVAGVWRSRWGIFVPRAGPLDEAVVGQLAIWGGLGFFLGRKARLRPRRTRTRRGARWLGFALLLAVGACDVLPARGIGAYPFSVIPGGLALVAAAFVLTRRDLLRARGLDGMMAAEVAAVAALAIGLYALFRATAGAAFAHRSALRGVAVVVVLAAAQLAIQIVRGRARAARARRDRGTHRAVDDFVDRSAEARDESELAALVDELFDGTLPLTQGRLLVVGEGGGLQPVGGEETPAIPVDARVRAWLLANRVPLVAEDLSPTRIGGLWGPIHRFLDALGAGVLLALVDRDRLLGAIAAKVSPGRRTPGFERALEQVQAAVARSLTYIALLREAEERVGMAQEVEIAAAVQQAHAPGVQELRLDLLEVKSCYRPSPTFGGDWSAAYALDDGRLLVAVGDVSGRGMPAALISATVAGACETAQHVLGAELTPASLLRVLNDCVLDVGKRRYAMSCFVALFDPSRREVVFSNAGHPFPYVARRAGTDSHGGLTSLVVSGIPLGIEAGPPFGEGRLRLRGDDVVLFYTDALVGALGPDNSVYGERRLRRILRDRAVAAGTRVCDILVEDLLAHYGDNGPQDDVTLVAVRLRGMGAARPRRSPPA